MFPCKKHLKYVPLKILEQIGWHQVSTRYQKYCSNLHVNALFTVISWFSSWKTKIKWKNIFVKIIFEYRKVPLLCFFQLEVCLWISKYFWDFNDFKDSKDFNEFKDYRDSINCLVIPKITRDFIDLIDFEYFKNFIPNWQGFRGF